MFDDLKYESPRHELQRRFAANFYRSQLPKYEATLGPAAAVNFTRWWGQWRTYRTVTNQFARTQREFNIEAQSACDGWLNTWAGDTTQKIIDHEPETVPTPEDDVERIKAAWGVDDKKAKRISEVIRKGTKKSIPAKLRKTTWTWDILLKKRAYQETQKQDDAVQDAWVTLLTKSQNIEGRDAHIAGINAGRDSGRRDAKLIPISQMSSDDPDAPEATLDSVRMFYTELDYQKTDDYHTDGAAEQEAVRLAILSQFKQESPDDYKFIVEYLIKVEREPQFRGGRIVSVSKRGSNVSPEERKRANSIISGLKQWELLELEK